MEPKANTPLTISAADLAALVPASRERAVAAKEALAELSPAQAAEVGGGAYYGYGLPDPFPWGTLPFWKMATVIKTATTQPAMPAADRGSFGF